MAYSIGDPPKYNMIGSMGSGALGKAEFDAQIQREYARLKQEQLERAQLREHHENAMRVALMERANIPGAVIPVPMVKPLRSQPIGSAQMLGNEEAMEYSVYNQAVVPRAGWYEPNDLPDDFSAWGSNHASWGIEATQMAEPKPATAADALRQEIDEWHGDVLEVA